MIIPNPIGINNLPKRDNEIKNTIVGVGRLSSQKNFALLINAFFRVEKEFPEYTLEIYGEGDERRVLEDQIEKLGLTAKVALKGAQKGVLEEIKSAKLFVLSSDFEGFPNALLEGMGIGYIYRFFYGNGKRTYR